MAQTTSQVSLLVTSTCSSAFFASCYFRFVPLPNIIFSYLNANGGSDPNTAIGNAGAALLIPNITDTRTALAALNLGKTIPVGTADAGSYFNNEVLAAVDYGVRFPLPRNGVDRKIKCCM